MRVGFSVACSFYCRRKASACFYFIAVFIKDSVDPFDEHVLQIGFLRSWKPSFCRVMGGAADGKDDERHGGEQQAAHDFLPGSFIVTASLF
ncbi:hypothetical protein QCO44_08710 [Selenomonas sputigena]|uniref:Secreted protein n=1 Tax=Selenomonas sputigena TaxID=69823 RepID=A0ABV3X677_9FIRM